MEGDCETKLADSVIPITPNFTKVSCRNQCRVDPKCEIFKFDDDYCQLFYNPDKVCHSFLGLSDKAIGECDGSRTNLVLSFILA